jgi:hypothetical protein
MKSSRIVAAVTLLILALAIAALARVSSSPQVSSEETISGTITATRMITRNARLTGNVTCTVDSAPCIQFGAPGITLNLNGFTLTGLADPTTSCQGAQVGTATGLGNEDGIAAIGQADEAIQGPGWCRGFEEMASCFSTAPGILWPMSPHQRIANRGFSFTTRPTITSKPMYRSGTATPCFPAGEYELPATAAATGCCGTNSVGMVTSGPRAPILESVF